MTMTSLPSPELKIKVPSVFAGKAWQQVLARDARADGQFVYAVKTTKIFCRPSCPSRRPERKNVTFFPTPELAVAAGYRACLRCEPQSAERRPDPQGEAIERVAGYLVEHSNERTRLKDVAAATGVAPLTILRGFKRVLGVTPREYAKAHRVAKFKEKIREKGVRVTDAIYAAGFGSSSRLYEGADETLGMTPSVMKAGGAGELIRYTLADCPLGMLLVGATSRGICAVELGDSREQLVEALGKRYAKAKLEEMDAELSFAVDAVLAGLSETPRAIGLGLDVRATAFQLRVWQALREIPLGETRTYSDIAEAVGSPSSVRAVAAACAANPVAILIPCHRVLAKNGKLTGYRWGVERKQQLLNLELNQKQGA